MGLSISLSELETRWWRVQESASEMSQRNLISPLYSVYCSASQMAAYIGGHHLQLKEHHLISWTGFQNSSLHTGLPFAIYRTILIGWTIGQIRGAFCLLPKVPPRKTLNVNLDTKKPSRSWLGVNSEAYPERCPVLMVNSVSLPTMPISVYYYQRFYYMCIVYLLLQQPRFVCLFWGLHPSNI